MPFLSINSTREDCWRSVISLERDVASYKFAPAKALLELAHDERNFVRLEELAVPFSRHIAEHLKHTPKQSSVTQSAARPRDQALTL
jgi:hypothetical protein